MELIKYIQYLPFLVVTSRINYHSFTRKTQNFFNFSFLFMIFITFFEITNLANLGGCIGLLYSSELHTENMLTGNSRIIATGSDPNVGAMISVFFLLHSLGKYIETRGRLEFVKILFFFFILLMTQSRTALLGFFAAIVYHIVFNTRISIAKKLGGAFFSLFIALAVAKILDLNYLILGVQYALEGTNISLNVRLENLSLGFTRFLQSPFWGWGPAKEIHDTVIDSEYVLILQRYGLAGIAGFSILILSFFQFFARQVRLYGYPNLYPCFAINVMVLSLFMMVTNNLFSGYQSASVIIFVLITNIALAKSYKKGMVRRI